MWEEDEAGALFNLQNLKTTSEIMNQIDWGVALAEGDTMGYGEAVWEKSPAITVITTQ